MKTILVNRTLRHLNLRKPNFTAAKNTWLKNVWNEVICVIATWTEDMHGYVEADVPYKSSRWSY